MATSGTGEPMKGEFSDVLSMKNEIDRLRASIDSIRATADREREELMKLREENAALLADVKRLYEPIGASNWAEMSEKVSTLKSALDEMTQVRSKAVADEIDTKIMK